MKKLFFILSFILIFKKFAFSQEIKEIVDKDGYNYIPISYLTDSTTKGILYSLIEIEGIIRENNEKTIEIFWYSICTDGRYNLTITPEQIYFTDGHENPNPNNLYWILTIDSLIYQQISNGFQENNIENKYFDSAYNEEILYKIEGFSYCDTLIEQQIYKFFFLLNSFIIDKTRKLDKANCIIPKKTIYCSFSEQDIESWKMIKE